MVAFVLRIYHNEAGNVDEDGNTPLHIGASLPRIVGSTTMSYLFDSYPRAALMQNINGCTPLHLASLHKAPLDVIQLLVEANPDAALMRNSKGQTPLFIALSVGSSIETLRLILKARPNCVNIRDEDGTSAIALAWNMMLLGKQTDIEGRIAQNGQDILSEERRSRDNCISLASAVKSSGLVGDVRQWMGIIDMLLRASFHGSTEDPLPDKKQWRAVHASCAGGVCPPELLGFALQLLPREVSVVNEDGNLPLHIVSQSEPHDHRCPRQLWTGRCIDMVLKISAGSALKTDRRGRLPLHLALASQKTWNYGVESLVKTFPEAIRMRDPTTGLFPFMIAATAAGTKITKKRNKDDPSENRRQTIELEIVNTIFMLLRAAPELVSSLVGNAETHFLYRVRRELTTELETKKEQLQTAEIELHKRMTPAELSDLAEQKKNAEARAREEERQSRAAFLANSSGQFRITLQNVEKVTSRLKYIPSPIS